MEEPIAGGELSRVAIVDASSTARRQRKGCSWSRHLTLAGLLTTLTPDIRRKRHFIVDAGLVEDWYLGNPAFTTQ